MLKEFALTPQTFDPAAAADSSRWRECIQAIGIRLFTQPATPIVAAGLHSDGGGCSWKEVAKQTVLSIEDDKLRIDAQSLLKRVSDILVSRPPCCDWPGDDEPGWGKEASDSHLQEPLHLIVAQNVDSVPVRAIAKSLMSALSPEFWATLQDEGTSPASLSEDVGRMRTVLVHSEMLVISAPYPSTTTDFAIECIRQASRRPKGFSAPEIHVHQAHSDPKNPAPRLAYLRGQLSSIVGRPRINWWFWPESGMYRERVILGGKLAQVGGGNTKFGVRAGVSMTHVWGEGNPVDAEPTTYALLSPSQCKRHADEIRNRAERLGLRPEVL